MRKIAVVVCLLGLTACGQTDPPTTNDIKQNIEYFNITSPSGVNLECVKYATESTMTNDSKSWFSFSCWKIEI
mgnify:CR=1 FL=1